MDEQIIHPIIPMLGWWLKQLKTHGSVWIYIEQGLMNTIKTFNKGN